MSSLKTQIMTASDIVTEFEACVETHRKLGIEDDTARAYRFYEGDQWYGLESGDEELPVYNFIAPIVRYKTAMVAMNSMSVNYSAPVSDSRVQAICASLSRMAAQKWERLKLDSKCWDVVRDAMIAGDSYLYFYDGDGACQVIDRTDIFMGDESDTDINAQPYIFIKERRSVADVRADAEKNGISKEVALTILADEDDEDYGKDKCLSLLKMWRVGDDLHFLRTTKTVVYQPETVIRNMRVYPIASLVCNRKRGTARGVGEVLPLIPNQIEINRNLARRLVNAKLTAYSRLVYSADRIVNPTALTEVGTAIEVEGGGVSTIKDAVNYLTPSSMSPDAKALSDELLSVTKDLSGAGDAALGNIDPTQASGSAIIAVRDQAALPLNEHTARFKQFAEDIANIWFRLWIVYNPEGLLLPDGSEVSVRELELMSPDVRIDISNTNPFSKFAREQALEKLFTMGQITFEEYVSALDDDSSVPKSKLEQILKNRGGNINVNRTDK